MYKNNNNKAGNSCIHVGEGRFNLYNTGNNKRVLGIEFNIGIKNLFSFSEGAYNYFPLFAVYFIKLH